MFENESRRETLENIKYAQKPNNTEAHEDEAPDVLEPAACEDIVSIAVVSRVMQCIVRFWVRYG